MKNRAQFLRWLNDPNASSSRWLGRHCVIVAWLGLMLALISSPHGSGTTVCWVQTSIGLPCIGCGMTRSLSCAIRGMFSESLHYHPFGLFVLAIFIFVAMQSLCSKATRERIARFMENRAIFFNGLYIAFVVTFVGFGILRAVLQAEGTWFAFR